MIRVSDLRKVYPTRQCVQTVLDGIDFTLRKGERLGILGRNGAGKSTLIRLVGGAEHPTSGTIERRMSVSWPLAFAGAFQPGLTGRDNVRFISRIYAQDCARNLAFVEDFAELGPYLQEPVQIYSSGMRARLAFAISMIIEFDCFLIDEIGSVGDLRFHERCNFELFERRHDRAMIIISHDPAYLRDHGTRWAVLEGGKLALHDDFDQAHEAFRNLALSTAPDWTTDAYAPRFSRSRLQFLEFAHRRAHADARFQALVGAGNLARDRATVTRVPDDWHKAACAYAAALALHPYERSYWVQHGHALKEQGDLAGAELSYRTASAHGEGAQAVMPHLQFVIREQGLDDRTCPPFRPGSLRDQVPGQPDIELTAAVLWNAPDLARDDVLALMRSAPSFDSLAAAMIADPRFQAAVSAPDPARDAECADRALRLFLPAMRESDRQAAWQSHPPSAGIFPLLLENGAFDDWPLTIASLKSLPSGLVRSPAA